MEKQTGDISRDPVNSLSLYLINYPLETFVPLVLFSRLRLSLYEDRMTQSPIKPLLLVNKYRRAS